MNPNQPADGQSSGFIPQVPGRPYDMSVPPRPAAPLPTPQTRPALDSLMPRTTIPASYRPAAQIPAPAPYIPPAAPVSPQSSTPSVTPVPAPYRPAPNEATPPQAVPQSRPQLRNYQDIQRTRPATPTVYSPRAMQPEQTPEQYRDYLNDMAAAQQQHIAATDQFLSQVPPPVEVPPKPVISTKKFGQQTAAMAAKTLRTLASIAVFFGLVWGGAAVLNAFVFQSYYVDGMSMQPSLGDDDRLIISKVERTKAQIENSAYIPERGQIIVIDGKVSDYTRATKEQLIKRVVGLPGDTVIIQNGIVIIKNKDNPEGFNVDKTLGLDVELTFTNEPLIVTVPDDNIFVLGDNRVNGGSLDSRTFGVVPSEYVLGRLWARVLPTDKLSVF